MMARKNRSKYTGTSGGGKGKRGRHKMATSPEVKAWRNMMKAGELKWI